MTGSQPVPKAMTKEYIAGFFDADGYITVSKKASNENATVIVGFTNNVRDLLEQICEHLYDNIGVKGYISLKKARSVNHSDSYDLKYTGLRQSIEVLTYLPILHPKKLRRFEVAKELKEVTLRNGKYGPKERVVRELVVEKLLNCL
jgi:intein-encoded DNA endonuclease-like protein